ncbi:hypothetical protein KEM48_012565 [Puccinia striiformis f. sp. tritici PST-130]|nr:hypothetical protein KEM48_012565 [Puccinia striiformis f. sp. tritici PST-130]
MSTIPSTQPTQNDSQQTPYTAREGVTQATTPQAIQPATQRGQGGGRGGRGGNRGARGGQATRRVANQPSQQGTRSAHLEGRYDLWRNSAVSKREVAKTINEYLIENGGESRAWKGIEQQTSQGILDEGYELARQAGGNPNNSDTEDFVGNAITQMEAQIRKICRYFYKLEPVMLDRPSAVPLNIHEQGNADENLAGALNLGPNEDRPTTSDHWSESERGDNALPVNTLGNPLPDINPTLLTTNGASATATPTGADTRYAERITDQLFPSREEMAAQTTAELDLHRDCLDNDSRMVDANIQLVNALSQQLAPTGPPAGTSHLQQRQLELDVGIREVELSQAQAALAAEQATGVAFARARMIQDFVRSGISPAEALTITNELFLGLNEQIRCRLY